MVEIQLTRGYVATIDDEDAELVSGYRWRVLVQPHTCYAIARLPRLNGKQRTQYMHRLVMGAKPGQSVWHADKDGLRNVKSNLRIRGAPPRVSVPARRESAVAAIPGRSPAPTGQSTDV
jgi:hypothetical protein